LRPAWGPMAMRQWMEAAFQYPHDAAAEGVEQTVQFLGGRLPGTMKGGPITGEGLGAFQKQHVQVNIQIQGRAEALDQGNCAGTCIGSHGEARQ